MAATYRVTYYHPDGHGSSGHEIARGTLSKCRQAIRDELGVRRLHPSRRWSGLDDDIEAYHEDFTEGCGGYSISPERIGK